VPYQENLSALIHDPTFKNTVGPAIFAKARLIKDVGNLAAHSPKPLVEKDSLRATEDLFHFLFWLVRTYSRGAAPPDSLGFDAARLPTETTSQTSVAHERRTHPEAGERPRRAEREAV
jgi:type I restriction enzyme R subunit